MIFSTVVTRMYNKENRYQSFPSQSTPEAFCILLSLLQSLAHLLQDVAHSSEPYSYYLHYKTMSASSKTLNNEYKQNMAWLWDVYQRSIVWSAMKQANVNFSWIISQMMPAREKNKLVMQYVKKVLLLFPLFLASACTLWELPIPQRCPKVGDV